MEITTQVGIDGMARGPVGQLFETAPECYNNIRLRNQYICFLEVRVDDGSTCSKFWYEICI